MATYYEMVRSNYFKVRDLDAFKTFLDGFRSGLTLITRTPDLVGFVADNGLPPYRVLEVDGVESDVEIDFLKELSEYLADGEVAIVFGIGNEDMRYLSGFSVAISSKGAIKQVSLDDIYDKAKTLTDRPDDITEAEY